MMTFAQKTIMELVRKSGAQTLPSDFSETIESVFEANAGSWERIAKGEAEQIGLLKQVVRNVLSGQFKAPEQKAVEPTPADRGAAAITAATEKADLLRHYLKPTILVAQHLDVDIFEVATQARLALDAALARTAAVDETDRVNTMVALDEIIEQSTKLGAALVRDAQKVRAWQVNGGADQPFDRRVMARDSTLRRTFDVEARAYESPWDALKVIAKSANDLSVEARRFLRGKVEMRLGPFFTGAVEALERLP
jgi:hypothetical protein